MVHSNRLFAVFLAAVAACAADEDPVDNLALAGSAQDGSTRWSSRTVAFTVDRSTASTGFATDRADYIEDAVLSLNDAGLPLSFQLYTWPTTPPGDYVLYIRDSASTGAGGYNGPGTNPGATIFLGTRVGELQLDGSRIGDGTVRHEIGHSIGMIHEHTRKDRDDYVDFICSCYDQGCTGGVPDPQPNGLNPFLIRTNSLDLTPYDYHSIMHYGTDGFSNGCATLERNDGGAIDDMGSTGFYTAEDRNALWQMYENDLGTNEDGDELGSSMATGDFDGDGYTDLAVGAPSEAPGSDPATGAVFLYKGTWGNGLVPWHLLEESDFYGAPLNDGDRFGAALAAYDMDDDGKAELFVGAPYHQTSPGVEAGAVFIYRGDEFTGLVEDNEYITQSDATGQLNETGDRFGAALAVANQDASGNPYLVVGAPEEVYNSISSGYVTVFKWTGGNLTYFAGFTNSAFSGGAVNGDRFGAELTAGDFDGDEISDIAVGAPRASSEKGAVYIYTFNGSAMLAVQKIQPSGLAAGDRFGTALADGDLDDDADDDRELVIGAPYRSGAGRVYIYDDGSAYGIVMSYIQIFGTSAAAGDRFGAAVATGNVNGSGGQDVVVGLPGKNSSKGQVWLFSSASDGTQSFLSSHAYSSPVADDELGSAVAVGDFNNNGFHNPVAGAPGRNDGAGGFIEFRGGTTPSEWRVFNQETSEWR